jgi:hypothetical protein
MPPRFSLNTDLTLGVNAPKLVVYIVNATHKLLPFFSKISLLQKALKDLFFFVFDYTSLQQGRSFVNWSLLQITSQSFII